MRTWLALIGVCLWACGDEPGTGPAEDLSEWDSGATDGVARDTSLDAPNPDASDGDAARPEDLASDPDLALDAPDGLAPEVDSDPDGSGGPDGAPDVACVPNTCEGLECGTIDDGCGQIIRCGAGCDEPEFCGGGGIDNRCGGEGIQTHGFTIPVSHPRLWFNPQRLARAREWFSEHPFTPPNHEDTAGGYVDVALHGLLSNNETGSCTAAITWAMSRTGDVQDTGGVACDPCRWSAEQLILVYDWCYAYMTPEQRLTFGNAMNAGLEVWSSRDWGGPAMYQNNYYWGYLRNELEWSITSYTENTEWAEAMLDFVFEERLGNGFNPSTSPSGASRGGIAFEGSEYGPVVGSYPLVPFISMAQLGRDLYQETDFWREFVYGVIHQTTPGPTTIPGVEGTGYTVYPFSDEERWNERFQAETHYFPDFMASIAQLWPGLAVGRHAQQWLEMVGAAPFRHVQAVAQDVAPLSFDSLPLDFYAAGPRYFYGRNAWGPESTAVFLQLGDGEGSTIGHQHGDYGTFQIWRHGRFLSHESVGYAGAGSTEVAGYAGSASVDGALAIAHNSVLFDGQSPGPQYTDGDAIVERLESRPDYAYAAVALVPPATQPQTWRREFVFVRSLETLVVFDRIEADAAATTRTFLNHCETAPVVSGNDGATCTVGDQALVMTTLLPAQRTYRVVDEGDAVYSQYRIEVDTSPAAVQSYILTVLQAKDAGATSLVPSLEESPSTFTLTLDGATALTLEKGMASGGGSIHIDGVTTSFRESVQPMTVTNDGPAWGE